MVGFHYLTIGANCDLVTEEIDNILFNPLSPILEGFKYAFLGAGVFDPLMLAYSAAFAIMVLFFGVIVFNRTERNFIDTV